MTWIKTVALGEASDALKRAVEAQKKLYPAEYASPVHPTGDGTSDIVASHSLCSSAWPMCTPVPPYERFGLMTR